MSTLFVIFLVLKLTHLSAWSWWWVVSPLWIPVALLAGIVLLVVTFAALMPGPNL